MAVQPIVKYPDQKLSAVCAAVTNFDAALATLISDLIDTMRAAPGVGITAAHIGVLQRVFVLEITAGDIQIFINPEITFLSSEKTRFTEGSVSMPGLTEEVERPASLSVTYLDRDGKSHSMDAEGFLSTCIQHEVDQLDGIFWIKRLSKLKRDRIIKKWEKQNRR